MKYVIGVDIGGTNTDAVLVDEHQKILSAIKTATTDDIQHGFQTALIQLLEKSLIELDQIAGVFVGTTHATNAIVQRKDLYRVGVIRIAGHYPEMLPSGFSWPEDLKDAVIGHTETIGGGFECDGEIITPICLSEARNAIENLLESQAESIAIIGVFSPLNGAQEEQVARLIREIAGNDFPISLSHTIGGIGFIERENAAILNAALKRVMHCGFSNLKTVILNLGLKCPLMLTQNDGSLISLDQAIEYPILTIGAGSVNSFIGGAKLAGLDHAIVVDIGGTSTDVGMVQNGFLQRCRDTTNIGGIMLNFSMPNVLSIGLGGGSIVKLDPISIGPASTAQNLRTESIAFGGSKLTLTDVALSMGIMKILETDLSQVKISSTLGHIVFDQVKAQIQELVLKIQGKFKDIPIVYVGGGAALFQESTMPYFDVANAYGAALANISGTVDTVISLKNRKKTLKDLHETARQNAIVHGADRTTLRLVDQQLIPYSYIPNQITRVIVRYSGQKQ